LDDHVHIGTSGWHYRHWHGPFYPPKTRSSELLDFYSQRLCSVEINNSFYRLPSRETFEAWARGTPKHFLFAVKASRFITHNKKLKDPEQPIERLASSACGLGKKLAVILFQLPPHWRMNVSRLEAFLLALPNQWRYAFEFREPSWFHEETYAVLRRHNAAFCVYQLAGQQSPSLLTADFAYIRLHGPSEHKYAGSYSRVQLHRWAERIKEWRARGAKDVFIYFDNDQAGYAAVNAMALQELMSKGRRRAA
jgi:uncharacterized protein YecE (DUF72 family)